MTKNGHIMAILSHKDKTYGAETSTTLISIDTYDLVRIIALLGVWKYQTTIGVASPFVSLSTYQLVNLLAPKELYT